MTVIYGVPCFIGELLFLVPNGMNATYWQTVRCVCAVLALKRFLKFLGKMSELTPTLSQSTEAKQVPLTAHMHCFHCSLPVLAPPPPYEYATCTLVVRTYVMTVPVFKLKDVSALSMALTLLPWLFISCVHGTYAH